MIDKIKKTAVAYCRYSCDRQTEQSIEGQLREIEEFAKRENIVILETYIDRATSGTTTDGRVEFQRMMDESKDKIYDYVIVYKLDRFARNRYDSALCKNKLKQNGKKVLSAKENISDNPEGIILEGMLEAYNEYFSAELSQKTKRGMRESLISGKITGRLPAGYMQDANKYIVIDEVQAEKVKTIFQEYLQCQNLSQTSKVLAEKGITAKNGKEISVGTLKKMLQNRIYIGETRLKSAKEVGKVPAIIDNETFNSVQEKLERAAGRKRKENHFYKYTGYMKCSCGGSYSGSSGGAGRPYYKCRKCNRLINEKKLQTLIDMATDKFLTDEVIVEASNRIYEVYKNNLPKENKSNLIKKELTSVNNQIDNCVTVICNGTTSLAIQTKLSELEKRKIELEKKLVQSAASETVILTPKHFEMFLRKIKGSSKASDLMVNCMVLYPEELLVCFNMTNENNTPDLEQIKVSINCTKGTQKLNYTILFITPTTIGFLINRNAITTR